MKTIQKINFVAILSLWLCGCSSAYLVSNKSPEFRDSASRIYIVLGGESQAGYFMKSLRYHLHTKLKGKGVTSKVFIPSALALDNRGTYEDELEKFQPDLVLFVEATNVMANQGATPPNNGMNNPVQTLTEFDLQLSKSSDTDLVWRATMSVRGNLLSDAPAKKAAKAIVEQFIQDGIIAGIDTPK